jgi:hypothetical protein
LSSAHSTWPSATGAALLSNAFLFIVGRMGRLFRTRFLFLIVAAFSISAQATDQPGGNRNATSGELFETPDIRRDLVKGSLEVYPIKDHGAIEIGEHRFCHEENGKGASPARTDCGTFKFAMVWRKSGESWKSSRVISHGH